MNSSLSEGTCDQSTSLESFSVCVVPPLKMPTSQTSGAIMCEKPQTDVKILAEDMPTSDLHKLTRCRENGDGIRYQCLPWR